MRRNQLEVTLSRYLGKSVAMMLEVADAISEGLIMTQLPAAIAPPDRTMLSGWGERCQSN